MDTLSAEQGFLGLDAAIAPENAKAVIVPFGLEASVSYGGGTAAGPAAIIEASHQVELFDEEFLCEPWQQYGVSTLRQQAIPTDIPAALAQLQQTVAGLLSDDKFPLVLGGEHSLSPGVIAACLEQYPDLAILHFDAHADLRDGYGGEHYSHAAALRRCLDYPVSRLISVGIRNISSEEYAYYRQHPERITIHWAHEKSGWDIDAIVAPLQGRQVYLTFDLDGFDGSLMAATGTPEPGGLFWDDAISVIRAAAKVCTIIGADVVELAPRPNLHACDFLAAKLCYKILNYALAKPAKE